MSEQIHIQETAPDKRKELVKGLRERGIDSKEVREALDVWTIEQEKKVEAAGRTPEARIGFEIERAKLYAEVGFIDEALNTLDDALYLTQEEGVGLLERKIRQEIAIIEGME